MSSNCNYTKFNLHDQLLIFGRECHPERLAFQSHTHVHSYHNDLNRTESFYFNINLQQS